MIMNASNPGLTAMSDQLRAQVSAELEVLARAVAEGDALNGEAQNGADLVAYLAGRYTPQALAMLVVTAVRARAGGGSHVS